MSMNNLFTAKNTFAFEADDESEENSGDESVEDTDSDEDDSEEGFGSYYPSTPLKPLPPTSSSYPNIFAPKAPTPSLLAPKAPTPSLLAPKAPAPSLPTIKAPAPSLPTIKAPAPSLPTIKAPSLPTIKAPTSNVPGPSFPTPNAFAPRPMLNVVAKPSTPGSIPAPQIASIAPISQITQPVAAVPTPTPTFTAPSPSVAGLVPGLVTGIPKPMVTKSPIQIALGPRPSIPVMTVKIEELVAKMPGVTLSNQDKLKINPQSSLDDILIKEPDESDGDFEARRVLTMKISNITEFQMNNVASVVVAHLFMKKARIGVSYDDETEAALNFVKSYIK
jgi:hypothetical protein